MDTTNSESGKKSADGGFHPCQGTQCCWLLPHCIHLKIKKYFVKENMSYLEQKRLPPMLEARLHLFLGNFEGRADSVGRKIQWAKEKD
jgi:hypothetical protein